MAAKRTVEQIEKSLLHSLEKDRKNAACVMTHMSQPDVLTVYPSNTSLGLAIWIGDKTGEDAMDVIRRVAE